jgi:creatinine amidohydrolase
MQMQNIHAHKMTWPEYEQRVADGAVVFLPVGATEQHGPHLPMGTDAIFAERMSEEVAREMNGMVLPVIRYGYKSQARSGGGQTFPGTTSLDGATLTTMVRDIIRELARHGVRKLVVLDGHYENQWFLTEAIELAQREFALQGYRMKIVRAEYWDFTPQAVYDQVFDGDFPGVDLEHAALIETSMMLYWHPQWVRRDKIPDHPRAEFPPHDVFPQNGSGVPKTGVLAPAGNASAEKGELIIESTVTAMVQALTQEFARY